ncbi:MAG: hypothetical protein CFH02_01778, partial [Alphaproteobacteria bacterium MarineAlpha3_Bin1]
WPVWTILGTTGLTILLLGIVYTQARGPWAGLAMALSVFLVVVFIDIGWRALVRAFSMSAAAIFITWAIATFIPVPSGTAELSSRTQSASTAVVSALSTEDENLRAPSSTIANLPSSEAQAVTRNV